MKALIALSLLAAVLIPCLSQARTYVAGTSGYFVCNDNGETVIQFQPSALDALTSVPRLYAHFSNYGKEVPILSAWGTREEGILINFGESFSTEPKAQYLDNGSYRITFEAGNRTGYINLRMVRLSEDNTGREVGDPLNFSCLEE